MDRSQDGKAPGPVPRRGPPYATDCDSESDSDSDSLAMARGEQSRATSHLLRIAHWNAERVRQKKLEHVKFFQKTISTSATSRRRILTVPSYSTYGDMKYTEMTEKIDPKEESPLLLETKYRL